MAYGILKSFVIAAARPVLVTVTEIPDRGRDLGGDSGLGLPERGADTERNPYGLPYRLSHQSNVRNHGNPGWLPKRSGPPCGLPSQGPGRQRRIQTEEIPLRDCKVAFSSVRRQAS